MNLLANSQNKLIIFFFACPKKKEKKTSGNDDSPFPAFTLIKLKCYCELSFSFSCLFVQNLKLSGNNEVMNREERRMNVFGMKALTLQSTTQGTTAHHHSSSKAKLKYHRRR